MAPVVRSAGLLVVSLIVLLAYPALPLPLAVGQAPTPGVSTQGQVFGHVLSDVAAPAAALGGARVIAQGSDSQSEAVSQPDGTYTMSLASGLWNVTVAAAGHAQLNTTVLVAPAGAEQNFTLQHTGSVVRGTVREAETGRGLGGVTVSANGNYACPPGSACPMTASDAAPRPTYYRMPTSTLSAKDGSYAIGVDAGSVGISASLEGYREAYESVDASKDAQLDLKLAKIPPQSAVLQGLVTDAKTGAPMKGAWVSAYPNVVYAQAAPAEEGNTTSAGSAGSAGTAAPSSIAMPCYGCGGYPQGNSTQTDAAGRYRMAMYPGTYQLNVGAQDHAQFSEAVQLADNQTATVDAKLDPIPPDSVHVHGQVVDAQSGAPVAGAYVSIENPQWGAYNGTQTGSDGRFDLRTKPGWSMVWVRAETYGYPTPPPACPPEADCMAKGEPNPSGGAQPGKAYYPWVQGASREDGQDVALAVKLTAKPAADVAIKGYVLNATSQKPIPGAWVNVHNEDTGDWGNVQTDKDGSFALLGRAGVHTITASADGHFPNAVVVSVPAQGLRVDIALQPGRGSYGGCCVAYAEGGRAVATPAPSMGPGVASTGAADSAKQESAGSASVQASGQQTYKSAGGLGPYNPATAPAPNGNGTSLTPGAKTPGFEAALALAAAGGAVLLLRRRR